MVVLPCTHNLELRWDLDQSTTKLVDTNNSHKSTSAHNPLISHTVSCIYIFAYAYMLNTYAHKCVNVISTIKETHISKSSALTYIK